MKLVISSKNGYITDFNGDTPKFGGKKEAMKFHIQEAIDLCMELNTEEDLYSTTDAAES